MPEGYGAPNFLRIIDAFEQGRQGSQRQAAFERQSRLADLAERGRTLTGQALAGNQAVMPELAQADPQAFINVKNFNAAQKAQRLDEIASGAIAADTPQKWDAFVKQFEAQGHTLDPQERLFANRQSLINQAVGVKETMAQRERDRQYRLEQEQLGETKRHHGAVEAQAAAELSGKPPETKTMYDAEGREIVTQWNPATRKFEAVPGFGPKAPAGGTSLEIDPETGKVTFTQGKAATESQSRDIGFLNRMTESSPIIDKHGDTLTSFGENLGARAPLIGNYMKSNDYRLAEQAGRNFLTALLRKESGATIRPDEEQIYGDIFLPRPGDERDPRILEQKKRSRHNAAIGIKMGLPAPLIASMVKQGVDFSVLESGPTLDDIDAELKKRGGQ